MADKVPSRNESIDSTAEEGARPEWEDSKTVTHCGKCQKKFTTTKRKHHCRACGQVRCNDCSNKRIELPEEYEAGTGKQRVCDPCYFYAIEMAASQSVIAVEKPDYARVLADLKGRAMDVITCPESEWKPWVDKMGVNVCARKQENSSLLLVRSKFFIKAPRPKVLEMYEDKALWKNWSPSLLDCTTREELEAPPNCRHAEVMVVTYKAPVVSNRDLAVFSVVFDGMLHEPDNADSTTILACSVNHPLIPKSKGIVRAWISLSCTHFISADGGTWIVSHIHADPKGLIPKKVVNLAISNAVGDTAKMRDYFEKHAE